MSFFVEIGSKYECVTILGMLNIISLSIETPANRSCDTGKGHRDQITEGIKIKMSTQWTLNDTQ